MHGIWIFKRFFDGYLDGFFDRFFHRLLEQLDFGRFFESFFERNLYSLCFSFLLQILTEPYELLFVIKKEAKILYVFQDDSF